MSTSIGSLPPPFPNAAQSLSKISGDAQLRERVERASESAPIKTEVPPEQSSEQTQQAQQTPQVEPVQAGESPTTDVGSATTGDAGNKVDLSV